MNGGHCPVAWERACRPEELGGLGIHNLETLGWALRMRWLWLSKTDPGRPWAAFNIKVHPNVTAMFAISVSSLVGDGRTTLFWKDRWLHGKSIEELAPALVPFVNKRARSRRTVNEAMQDLRWVGDIAGGLSVPAILDYLELWDTLENVQLLENQPDQHLWTPESSGTYSARSAYARFFVGSSGFEPYKRLWKSWAPLRCKIFLWLAMLNRCWTADRLARRGLQHPDKCLLCDQEEETVQHILTSCVFARQVWTTVLGRVGLQHLAPTLEFDTFKDWWRWAARRAPKAARKGMNSLLILTAWSIWKMRNRCMFDGCQPAARPVLQEIHEQANLWKLAGAKALGELLP